MTATEVLASPKRSSSCSPVLVGDTGCTLDDKLERRVRKFTIHLPPRPRALKTPDSPQSSTSPSSTLARGTACLACRRRKMRCDGVKPVCGQCISKGREEDCEYTSDTQGLTRTQLLEENIALLEARIRELEHPSEATSVKLHDPVGQAPGPSDKPLTLSIPNLQQVSAYSGDAASPIDTARPDPPREPDIQEVHNIINDFIPYASQTGFFLNMNRFIQVAYLTPRNRDPLQESLVSAVCLWGSHLSPNAALRTFEARFLAKAVQDVSASLFLASAPEHRMGLLSVVQAEVLLATYFYARGRFLEGRYHGSAAASLALSCGLNILGAPGSGVGPALNLICPSRLRLPPTSTADAVDHGERVNAFWEVYILDKCWSVALGSPSSISDTTTAGTRIVTPWPLGMAQYEQGQAVLYTGREVVTDFLNSRDVDDVAYASPIALRAKAATLFSQASVLASRYHPDMPDKALFWHEFSQLDNLITAFINRLPLLPAIAPGVPCETLVACTIARVAVIQLHIRFAREQSLSRDSCVAAANSILATVQALNAATLGYLDPIMAILLSAVCQVYINEIKAYGTDDGYATRLKTSLERVLAIMTDFGAVCPLMESQAAQVREAQARV